MTSSKRETLFTSHEVGELLQMDPSSVVKWVNDGKLPAFRTPGGHRRIKATDLLAFLRAHGMYIPAELQVSVKRVLLVDDDPSVLSALQRAMRSHKDRIELHTCDSGIEALVKVGALKPDALVIDVHMPELDGMEVLERLKASPETRSLEVILFTGKPTTELDKRARALGAVALLPKPLTPTALIDVLLGPVESQRQA